MEQHGFLIACLICSLETRTTVVRVLNPSPAPVYSNQQVRTLQPFDEPSASALQLSENCNKINPGPEEAVQQMMAQVEDLSTSERERLQSHSLFWENAVKHKIDTGNAAPIRQPARKFFHQKMSHRDSSRKCCQETSLSPPTVPGYHQ